LKLFFFACRISTFAKRNELTSKRFYVILNIQKAVHAEVLEMTKNIIKAVVDKADPIGLLGMCCPADEYDSEIEIIFARIRKGMSADEIAKVIHAVFLEMFNESIDKTLCDTMAKEMLSLDCLGNI
jgi:domain of unknown function (DUF1871)